MLLNQKGGEGAGRTGSVPIVECQGMKVGCVKTHLCITVFQITYIIDYHYNSSNS